MIGDGPPLGACRFGPFPGEGRGDEGRDHAAARLSGMGQHVPHEVYPAPQPCRAQCLADGGLDAFMGV
jgi:hypothetical protein